MPIDEHVASNMVGVVQLLATACKNNSVPTVVQLHRAESFESRLFCREILLDSNCMCLFCFRVL